MISLGSKEVMLVLEEFNVACKCNTRRCKLALGAITYLAAHLHPDAIFLHINAALLALNGPIATKLVCFSRLLKCLRSLYGKQCGPRSDFSYRSSLFWVHAVCFYT